MRRREFLATLVAVASASVPAFAQHQRPIIHQPQFFAPANNLRSDTARPRMDHRQRHTV